MLIKRGQNIPVQGKKKQPDANASTVYQAWDFKGKKANTNECNGD